MANIKNIIDVFEVVKGITANVEGFAQAGHWNWVSPAAEAYWLLNIQVNKNVGRVVVSL
jgi:hypothetical protein